MSYRVRDPSPGETAGGPLRDDKASGFFAIPIDTLKSRSQKNMKPIHCLCLMPLLLGSAIGECDNELECPKEYQAVYDKTIKAPLKVCKT
ncbi:hypothetical protein JZ751_009230 [Albula glossodonta]|uniref:Uncharacterized protein n=1 Tax=Albula glossodonta TaxID=121402 RepID=A0A8T2MU54_9TELE|nr:hypothetical protein JZ751_009230 [Albula glossodonta]